MTMHVESEEMQQIPFFGAARAHAEMEKEIVGVISRVISSGQSFQGKDVVEFEERLAAQTGRAHALAVSSATDGLFFALRALGIGPGDSVLVPALTFVASASCILRAGAEARFVDVDETGQMNLKEARLRVDSTTKAVLAVHLFGGMMNANELLKFALESDLFLIEDAAQAFGASYGGNAAGSIGDVSIFSFDPTKVVSGPGAGGAVLVDDEGLVEKVKCLRFHGRSGGQVKRLGYNSQMSTLVAGTLNLKLKRHRDWTLKRRRIAEVFDDAFRALPLRLHKTDDAVDHVHQKYPILSEQRNDLKRHLTNRGIPTRIHYERILPDEPIFDSFAESKFPISREIAKQTLSLPIHAYLTNGEVERVVDAVTSFYSNA